MPGNARDSGLPWPPFSFHGEFTRLYVWSRALALSEIRSNYACRDGQVSTTINYVWLIKSIWHVTKNICCQLNRAGLALDWASVGIQRGESVTVRQLDTDCPASLNDAKSTLVGFEHKVSRQLTICAASQESETEAEKINRPKAINHTYND